MPPSRNPTAEQIRRASDASSPPIPVAGMVSSHTQPVAAAAPQLQALGSTRSGGGSKSVLGSRCNSRTSPVPAAATPVTPVFQFGAARNNENQEDDTVTKKQDNKREGGDDVKQKLGAVTTLTIAPTAAAAVRSDLTAFESLTKDHIRPLIELNDSINALLSRESQINPTSIVVAGDQSHGKTSLLEALSGVDLPRGEGIQTRVPLVLQLRAASFGDEHAIIRIQSDEKGGERISLTEIADKVREYTNTAAGDGKDIKDNPIELKVYRNGQDDLTLTDLPGITRVAMEGQAGGSDTKLLEIITDMYRKYLKPDETIILNVASANVDTTTSESMKISRDLDKKKERTMICITKVDEHASASRLNKAIEGDIEKMKLNPDNVFAVRNRSQDENDEGVSLEEVRKRERQHLEKLAREQDGSDGIGVGYGLGVDALSKRLVTIQRDQILKTLPGVRKSVDERIDELQRKLNKLGKPVGDAAACRAKVLHCIEASVSELQNEAHGRAPQPISNHDELKAGTMFEISLTIDDFSERRKQEWEENTSVTEKKLIGGFQFKLSIFPQCKDSDSLKTSRKENVPTNVGGFLEVESLDSIDVKIMVITYSIATTAPGGISETFDIHSKEFSKQETSWGTRCLLNAAQADGVSGPATFVATVFIKAVEFEQTKMDSADGQVLLCAKLNNLQEELVTSIDTMYSNHYFFSTPFRTKLAHEVSGCRGGIGLPGTIAPHVPVNILEQLRQKLPEVIAFYRCQVKEACKQKMKAAIGSHFKENIYPNLHKLVSDTCSEMLDILAMDLVAKHALLLEWENSVYSSNHYFMDTVQSIRSSLAKDDEDRPAYLKHLSEQSIKKMSNEDQRIIDMQIEIFAYWKLMKKRLVDYIIMSSHSELVDKPIFTMMKPTLLEATMSRGDKDIVSLLEANPKVVRERKDAMGRLELLRKAQAELKEQDQKTALSWV